MKNIYFQYIHRITFYSILILFANISLAQGESSTYFERTASYYRIQKEVMNPFYKGITNLSVISPNIIQSYHSINPKNILKKLKSETTIGLNEQTFIVREQYDNNDIIMPSVISVDYYIENRMYAQNQYSFIDEMKNNFNQNDSKISNKSKAISILNRNIGNTNIMVDIKGSLEINGELEFVEQEGGNQQDQDNWNLDINQKQRFDLKGNIGDRFTVSADQNSESDFDWENALLIQYEGYENEIIKKISAGNISLQLPHTQLVSVGMGKREGLFGIKMESNFGNLSLNTIIGREKVKKESFSLSDQASGISRYDYEFIRNKYFYIDEVFKLFHYPKSKEHKKNHHIRDDYGIVEIEVYKKSQTTSACGSNCHEADAYIDPSDPENSFKQSGRWEKLQKGDALNNGDYTLFDDQEGFEMGVIRLNTVSSSDAVAVHYVIGKKNNNTGGYEFVDEEYNKTYTNIDAQNSTGDECIDMVFYCEDENLVFCSPDEITNGYGECTDAYNNDEVIENITEFDNCKSHIWEEDKCKSYNYDSQEYEESEGLNDIDTQVICESINHFEWSYDCNYLDNDGDGEYTANRSTLKLIKTLGQQTYSSETWDLMLKNVYSLGTRYNDIDFEDPPVVQIVHVGGQLGTETASSTGNTYLNIFGLDNLNSGDALVYGGDGQIDGQGVINKYGDLFLPFHMPFAFDEGSPLEYILINGVEEGIYWGNNNPALENLFDDDLSNPIYEDPPCVNTVEYPNDCLDIPGYYKYTSGPDMYFSSNDNPQKEFKITVTNINQSYVINLDFMIVEGSETLTSGTDVLLINSDYKIDYQSGTLTLVSERAKNAVDNLTISYDKREIVSFDQKIIFGNYFKYDFSKDANIFGGAYMYTQEITQKKVDIGYEPMENSMWHIGGNYSREFEALNERINKNSSLNLDKPSKIEILAEYAEISPNPNPLGVAYIDNFEGSAEGYNIGDDFSLWKLSSPPLLRSVDSVYKANLIDRYKMMWYNPIGDGDIKTKDIWDIGDENVNDESKEVTLWLELPNVTACSEGQGIDNYDCFNDEGQTWWSGITTYISDHEQSDKRYLDIWLTTEGAGTNYPDFNYEFEADASAKLHIDIGNISEDINLSGGYPNQEDSPYFDEYTGSGLYEASEDVGIDSCKDEDEDGWGGCLCKTYEHSETPYDHCTDWKYGTGQAFNFNYTLEHLALPESQWVSGIDATVINIYADPADPNDDNYMEYEAEQNWYNYNGTQGNQSLFTYSVNDTEDFDLDGSLDETNSYFTYEIDLFNSSENDDIILGESGNAGWTLYRIPLNNFESIKENDGTDPDWNNIQHFRLRLEGIGIENYGQVGIASIELVGNEWKNLGVISNDYSLNAVDNEDDYIANDNISIEVVNTYQNLDYSPPDDIVFNTTQNFTSNEEYKEMEQSLVLAFENCESICDEETDEIECQKCGIEANSGAYIKKIFPYSGYDAQRQKSFFAYKNMEMYYKAINTSSPASDYLFDPDIWGIDPDNQCTEEGEVEMVFRFGKDDNYYEITQVLDNNCEGDECDNAWNDININLEELTYFKKRINTPYDNNYDVGIDGCANNRETGKFIEVNGIIIPQCLEEESEDFSVLCALYSNNNCNDIDSSSEFDCNGISDKINVSLCEIDLEEEYYKIYSNGKKHYLPNKNDPNGDDYQIPYEDCCISGDNNCNIDDIICSSIPRKNIDCVDSEVYNVSCTDLPECPDLTDSFEDLNLIHDSLLSEIPNLSSGSFQYLGSEENYKYDCYYFYEISDCIDNDDDGMCDFTGWGDCPGISELPSDNSIYSDNSEDFNMIVETNEYDQYLVPPESYQEFDIWRWDREDTPEIDNVCEKCTSVSIKGQPAINRIEYVIVGVKNDTSSDIYGSMFINELRLSGVKKEKGSAFMTNLKFNLGDLFDFNLSYKQEEANYHKIEERLSSGSNKINYSATIGFKPHEFLKQNYFEIPINITYKNNVSSPLYKTGSDVYLGTSIDDATEDEKTKNKYYKLSTSLKTNLGEYFKENLFMLYFLDKSKINYAYTYDKSSTPTIKNKLAISKKIDYSYNLVYNKNNFWQPFKNIFEKDSRKYDDGSAIVKILKEFKIYYSPKDLQFAASYTDNNTSTLQREFMGSTLIEEENINLYRSFKTSYQLSDNFLINYNVDMRNNLNEYNDGSLLDVSKLFDLNFSPGIKKTNSEKFTFTYNPQILDWLSPRFTYSPRYTWTRDLGSGNDVTADIKSENDFSASFALSFQKLIEKFYKPDTKTTSSRNRSSRNRRTNSNAKSQNLYIDQPHFKTILKFLHDLSKKLSSISVNYKYNTKNNYNNIIEDFIPNYSFKLGLEDSPFDGMNIQEYTSSTVGGYSFTKHFYQELKFNTTLQVTNNLSISNLEYKISFAANNQSASGYNETKAYSYFPSGDRGDKGIPIFNWSVNYRGIEKIGFLKNWFKTITLNHNYNGEKSQTIQGESTETIDFRRSFSPLLGIKLVPKNWPLIINFNFNNNLTFENTGQNDTEKKGSEQINITFDYKRDGGMQIPIFFLRDFEIENKVDLKLTLGYDKSYTDVGQGNQDNTDNQNNSISENWEWERIAYTNSYNIKPEITYSFSKYIDGNFYVNYSVSETSTTGSKETTDIGFKIKIVFESFK